MSLPHTSPHLHALLLCCWCVLMLTTFCPLPVLLPLHFLTWSLDSYRHGRWIDELRYHCIQPNFSCVTVLVPDGFLGCPAPGLLLQRSCCFRSSSGVVRLRQSVIGLRRQLLTLFLDHLYTILCHIHGLLFPLTHILDHFSGP